MSDTDVRKLTTDQEWDEAVPVLRQLWGDADESFVRSWREEEHYHLFGLYDAGELVGVVGVSVQRVLHHVRHAWVHDLVVREAHRSQGYGTELLRFAEGWAEDRDCEYVALATIAGNDDALRFYEAEGYDRWGDVVEREL